LGQEFLRLTKLKNILVYQNCGGLEQLLDNKASKALGGKYFHFFNVKTFSLSHRDNFMPSPLDCWVVLKKKSRRGCAGL